MMILLLLQTILFFLPVTSWVNPTLAPSKRVAVRKPPNDKVKIVILPGFGNDSNDYTLSGVPEGSLVRSLQTRGWEDITVLPIRRLDWLQVFLKGLFDWKFWLGRISATDPAFRWYLDRIGTAVAAAASDDKQVLLICHSAGGWLARAALGHGVVEDLTAVCGIATLGSPHLPPPPDRMDMTRGALRETDQLFPGAYHSDSVFYVTVAGDAIQGVPEERDSMFAGRSPPGFAYESYDAVCGVGTSVGDGVVPVSHAHLEGASQVNLLGVFHSINAPEKWYGSDSVLDSWHEEVLFQLSQRVSVKSR